MLGLVWRDSSGLEVPIELSLAMTKSAENSEGPLCRWFAVVLLDEVAMDDEHPTDPLINSKRQLLPIQY